MKIPIPSGIKMKRNGILLISMILIGLGMGEVDATENVDDKRRKGQTKPKSSKSQKKTSSTNRSKEAIAGTLDFHTKMLLVTVSIFMLIFVIALLVIGHFTWFADIRKKLEEEWEEELKAEEEKRVAKNILSEMINPFEDEERGDERRMSVDSIGCTRGQCVPPHHSILCPNNPNVPSLNEPFSFHLSSNANSNANAAKWFDTDPIEYRNRPSTTEWMNLDSSVKISGPLPRRDRTESRFYIGNNFNFSTGMLGRKAPMAPATPDPDMDMDLGEELRINSFPRSTTTIASPQPKSKFDLTKLDML